MNQTDAHDDTTEVSQVEDVMRLGWSRKQTGYSLLIDVHRGKDNVGSKVKNVTGKVFLLEA